ncbi:hypothetical protein GGR50DRAFT_656472, partial [Xylaria sp. CBS 124048]
MVYDTRGTHLFGFFFFFLSRTSCKERRDRRDERYAERRRPPKFFFFFPIWETIASCHVMSCHAMPEPPPL